MGKQVHEEDSSLEKGINCSDSQQKSKEDTSCGNDRYIETPLDIARKESKRIDREREISF